MEHGQINYFDEIITDNFAGGGGASTGIELATGRVVDIAVNHDAAAILMHRTNHPHTVHYQASIWDIDPSKVCSGRPVGLAWFSPDCKHFSRAKGGKPKDKSIRGLAWIALRWAGTVRPRVIILENVVEFQDWGPLNRGHRPIQAKKGVTFRKFVGQLRELRYVVEWRELVASDFGAPTTRKRFFLIARCDGRPVIWPEPTHAPQNSEAVKAGKKKPWRSAGEVIDWSLPCPSIFDTREEIKAKYGLSTQRPLAENTMRRVARGLDRYVIKADEPYIIRQREKTTAAANLIQYHSERMEHVRGQELGRPIMTIDAANRYALTVACLTKYYGRDHHGQDINTPLHTVTAKDREGLLAAHMIKLHHNDTGSGPDEPLPTVTAGGLHHGAVVCRIVRAEWGAGLQNWPRVREMLNTYCGYALGADELILFEIYGERYFIADVGLRMLTPRELYRANGFPDDYIIDRDFTGKPYPRCEQVARCGNAVPPPFASALVRANLPEWCGQEIRTMAELERAVTA